jgi:AcrR family transcriptional regulator
MPRHIDRDQRERDVTEAALRILANDGPGALTLKNLAQALGGSQTLITYFYPNRQVLLSAITDRLIEQYDAALSLLESDTDDPVERLRLVLEWMLPTDDQSQLADRSRVLMVSRRDNDDSVRHFYDGHETKMRQLLREHLAPVLPGDRVEEYVELLRVTMNGVTLSCSEHPGEWPEDRQLALLDTIMRTLPLRTPTDA